jgi:16S rRNA (guanine527-N7)-methyltransferase
VTSPKAESAAAATPPPALLSVLQGVFGDQFGLVREYATLLATDGVEHGLLGPRERERLWDRHLLNCALMGELVPQAARIVDVGTGAGLPGLVLACSRPDLRVDLVDSMQRRVNFLNNCVQSLTLSDRVWVARGRAEDAQIIESVGGGQWVTARAVAPLDRLAQWCLPLLGRGGTLLALKGARAEDEVAQYRGAVRRLGGTVVDVVRCGVGLVPEPTVVVVVRKS